MIYVYIEVANALVQNAVSPSHFGIESLKMTVAPTVDQVRRHIFLLTRLLS